MIKEITIKKLFGRFDYQLVFKQAGIMIITGPNGYGKSTILRMLNCFCNSDDLKTFLSYPFQRFVLSCENESISIAQYENMFQVDAYSFPQPKLDKRIGKEINDSDDKNLELIIRNKRIHYKSYLDHLIEDAIDEAFKETEQQELINNSNILKNNKEYAKFIVEVCLNAPKKQRKNLIDNFNAVINKIDKIKKKIGTVQFIQEQRLLEKRVTLRERRLLRENNNIKYVNVINENSEKLKIAMAEVMKNHSTLSSNLDSTYIKRLFDANLKVIKSHDTIREQLKELQQKQAKLQKYGLAEIQNVSYISKLDETKLTKFAAELTIFLADAKAKYDIFEPIINKLELYEKIVNKKLTFKKIQLSSSKGIEIIGDDSGTLSLDDLSSGEKEILVLFYKLIFVSDVKLLLIDEPEISLHIAWQKELLDDFKNVIILNKNMQMIIATHSPQIISENWDLQIDLGEQSNG